MKAIIVPYADMKACKWALLLFADRSIASLPICGKPFVEYQIDECVKEGATEILIADWAYDAKLAEKLGDGSRWGIVLKYCGCGDDMSEDAMTRSFAGFVNNEDVRFIWGNVLHNWTLDSLDSYVKMNFSLLEDPKDYVLPGYSSEKGFFAGMNVVIKQNADISIPVYLGDNVRLERDVKIKGGAILGNNVIVERGTILEKAIVLSDTYIGSNMDVRHKIVSGRRIIDMKTGVFIDLDESGLSSNLRDIMTRKPVPATILELQSHKYTALQDELTENMLAEVLASIALDIAALNLKKVRGIYLGGGYGRGEGGVPLYNDLDFFVLADKTSYEEKCDIQVALNAASMKYAEELGIHVDFCFPKTEKDYRKDEKRLMIQEFIRGFVPIYGSAESLSFIHRREAVELPYSEALRLLVNRGMGLLLARTNPDPEFVKRNINKVILGAGDAKLIVDCMYSWRGKTRARFLKNALYDRALEFKFHPVGDVASWDEAKTAWEEAADYIMNKTGYKLSMRGPIQALRWLVRRHNIGNLATFGCDPLYRIFVQLQRLIHQGHDGEEIPKDLLKDWDIFN